MHQATAETLTISCCTCSAKPLAPSASRAERANLRSVAFQIPGISVRLELSNPRNFREFYTRWCSSSLAKLVNITPISLWFMADITIVNGVYKPTYNWGAPSCRDPWFLVGGWVGMMTWPQYDGKIKFMFQTTNQFFWWTILAISETLLLHEFGTSTNLGRYHRLPHGCTMYGILFRKYYWKVTNCKHMGTVYDRSFKRGLAICYGPITCPMCCTISENQCHSIVCFSLPEFLRWFLCVQEFSISDWGSIFHNI